MTVISLKGDCMSSNDELSTDQSISKQIPKLEKSLAARLVRLETKLVRGFEEQGIVTELGPDWLWVDHKAGTITIDTLGHSLMAIIKEIRRDGAELLPEYTIFFDDKAIGSLRLKELGVWMRNERNLK